jgi:hypothetical protein
MTCTRSSISCGTCAARRRGGTPGPRSRFSPGTASRWPRPGVHFIGFGPSAQHFEKMRLEMDGVEHQQRYGLPEQNLGFTKMLVTTHRQNFLLPPRAHRSMPLAEML